MLIDGLFFARDALFYGFLLLIRILQGVSLPGYIVVVYRRSLPHAGSHERVVNRLTLIKSCDAGEDPITC
jgi:hypothetical protein